MTLRFGSIRFARPAGRARSERLALVAVGLLLASAAASPVAASDEAAAAQARLEAELWTFVPQIIQLSSLASYDPVFAARMIPEAWLASAVSGAIAVAAEEPMTRLAADPPRSYPVGPWPTETDLVSSVEAIHAPAARDLYRALEPRITARCQSETLSFEECERRFRIAAERLSAPALEARLAGNVAVPVTRTQRELVQLGPRVLASIERKLEALSQMLWQD